jgi:hypothetical protein
MSACSFEKIKEKSNELWEAYLEEFNKSWLVKRTPATNNACRLRSGSDSASVCAVGTIWIVLVVISGAWLFMLMVVATRKLCCVFIDTCMLQQVKMASMPDPTKNPLW